MSAWIGPLAGLTTAGLWSTTALLFESAGRRVGSRVVNRSRLLFALVLLAVVHALVYGSVLPLHEGRQRWAWLAASAVLGLVIGDGALFESYLHIGPRRAMLVMSTAPIWGALAAWPMFGETFAIPELIGVGLTLSGVAWVLTERSAGRDAAPATPHSAAAPTARATPTERAAPTARAAPSEPAGPPRVAYGIALALIGAWGQAMNLVTAKMALVDGFPAFSATVMRMAVAVTVLWGWAILRGNAGRIVQAWRDGPALRAIALGSIVGPVLGVWLSLVAVQTSRIGVAATLMALPPVLLIPMEWAIHGRRASRRAVAGTVVAFVGVAILLGSR